MDRIPRHVAIIMDGNGRWAQKRGLSRSFGHRQGAINLKKIVKASQDLGIKVLTVFAFSTENWDRPKKEIDVLMRQFDAFLKNELNNMMKNRIRLMVSGRERPIPEFLLNRIREIENKTKGFNDFVLNIAFNYGGRNEIVDAARSLCSDCIKGNLKPGDIDENLFSRYLYTKDLPELDLLIRTSGELRISNFLLWQTSYAELYFTEKYWPDFSKEELEKAIAEYNMRERRFGRV